MYLGSYAIMKILTQRPRFSWRYSALLQLLVILLRFEGIWWNSTKLKTKQLQLFLRLGKFSGFSVLKKPRQLKKYIRNHP